MEMLGLVVKFIGHVCVLVILALLMLGNGVFQINLLLVHTGTHLAKGCIKSLIFGDYERLPQ